MSTRVFIAALSFLLGTVPVMVLADDVLALPSHGTVESVREVNLAEVFLGLTGAFQHAYMPPSADELLVTLDDGRAITVLHAGTQSFAPGQRVRVVSDGSQARIEHAHGHLLP